ncbi:MAG: tetratricopeptide repeat protein, partial [Chloroflexi bacterium]|nr:tetratricopeptide repeat protein [Chloroflexota bacterium]
ATRALLHHQAQRFEEAIADYDRSLELRPGDAVTLNNRADARLLLGDLDLALEDIEAAVAANPALGIAHYTRGQILDELGRAEDAQAAYEEAARLGYEPPEDVG